MVFPKGLSEEDEILFLCWWLEDTCFSKKLLNEGNLVLPPKLEAFLTHIPETPTAPTATTSNNTRAFLPSFLTERAWIS